MGGGGGSAANRILVTAPLPAEVSIYFGTSLSSTISTSKQTQFGSPTLSPSHTSFRSVPTRRRICSMCLHDRSPNGTPRASSLLITCCEGKAPSVALGRRHLNVPPSGSSWIDSCNFRHFPWRGHVSENRLKLANDIPGWSRQGKWPEFRRELKTMAGFHHSSLPPDHRTAPILAGRAALSSAKMNSPDKQEGILIVPSMWDLCALLRVTTSMIWL